MLQLTCETCGARFSADRRRRYCARSCRPSERPYAAALGSIPPTADRSEVLSLLWAAARKGSVAAMQLLRAELGREGSSPATESVIDELADRRRRSR